MYTHLFILSHAGEVSHDIDAVLLKRRAGTNTRHHQELGRVPLKKRITTTSPTKTLLTNGTHSLTTPAETITSFRADK